MLEIQDLRVSVSDQEIIKGLNLKVAPGEVHALMGLNGSGKSTLAYALAGADDYRITSGSLHYTGKDLTTLSPEERAIAGIFLAFQYPVELPGVLQSYFLRSTYNAQRKARGEPELGVREFSKFLEAKLELLRFDRSMLQRSVNEGFSGGEKKRNEILQMAVLNPRLAILDETDSGLDIDALKIVADGLNSLRAQNPMLAIILITHYQRLLNFVVPDYVHVMLDGRIIRSGSKALALELEERGYEWLKTDSGGSAGVSL